MKINVTFQIELPDDVASVDGMNDINPVELIEKVRHDVEYFTFTGTDANPDQVRVSVVINGEIQSSPDPVEANVSVELATPSGVLSTGTRVIVTLSGEETEAEVIGYDNKYRLHKVRTRCGKVLLRKVHAAA